jgi:hypothetical protein
MAIVFTFYDSSSPADACRFCLRSGAVRESFSHLAPPPPPFPSPPFCRVGTFMKMEAIAIRATIMSNRAQLLRVAEFAMARGGARPAWYDGVRLVPPASFPTRSEAASIAGSSKPKALPKIVFEQDAFYARIRHKFPQLQKEPFSLAHGRSAERLLSALLHAVTLFAASPQTYVRTLHACTRQSCSEFQLRTSAPAPMT